MMFSRFFEAVRKSGPKLISDNLIIAVNSTGVYLVDETEQVLVSVVIQPFQAKGTMSLKKEKGRKMY